MASAIQATANRTTGSTKRCSFRFGGKVVSVFGRFALVCGQLVGIVRWKVMSGNVSDYIAKDI